MFKLKEEMSVAGNVFINGRTAVHAGSGGTLTTVDVCKTKVGKSTVAISYINVAQSKDAAKTAATVFVNGHPVCTKDSVFSKSAGDEPGNKKGVRSGTIRGQAEFITASPNVFIEGVAAARAQDLMVSNNQNTPPAALMQPGGEPPQALAAGAPSAELEAEEGGESLYVRLEGGEMFALQGAVVVEEVDPQ